MAKRAAVQEAHSFSWDKFVRGLEQDLINQQRNIFEIIKHVNSDKKGTLKVDSTTEQEK